MGRFTTTLSALVLCLVVVHADAPADEEGAATARLRAAVGKLPEPTPARGFAFSGEIRVGGQVDGTFSVSAKASRLPGDDEGPLYWLLEEHRKQGTGDEAVEVRGKAYVKRTLALIRGEVKKTQYEETSTWTWSRKDARISIHHEGPRNRPVPRRVEAPGPVFANFAAAILFARHAPATGASYAGTSFHPDFEILLGQDPFVDARLNLEGQRSWRGRPAFLVTGRWRGRELTLALDPERRAPLGWRLVRKDAPPVEFLPKRDPTERAADVFTSPARSAQAAAIRAGYGFSTNDMKVLGDVIHWATLRERMGAQVPASVTPEAFRSGLLKRIEETARNPQSPEVMRPVLKALLGTLPEKTIDGGVVVTFPPMFRSLAVTVAKIDGIWYLVEMP